MKKAKNIVDVLPDLANNLGQYVKALKDDFNEHGKDYVDSSSGTVALILKFLGKPFLEKHYAKREKKKLENDGNEQYIIASVLQAEKSLKSIEDYLDPTKSPSLVFSILRNSLQDELKGFDRGRYFNVYNLQYHPIVQFIKNSYERILKDLETKPEKVKEFTRNFNEGIEATIKSVFGEAFEIHTQNLLNEKLVNSELRLLFDQINASKIGFKENENLKYERTFAEWINLNDYGESDREDDQIDDVYIDQKEKYIGQKEDQLSPIEEAIEDYFGKGHHSLNKILFIVSDFGKGKSVFLKHFTAELAKNYIDSKEGYFPVYFNLRNFQKYSSETKLGVIANYLETEYGIKIDSDYYKKRKYFFLIDSLDESGDLTENSISKVIESVRSIQNIDKENCRDNRIIITTRPLDNGLEKNIKIHEPFEFDVGDDRKGHYFLSIYGFKKDQFNDWLLNSLKNAMPERKLLHGFTKNIIKEVEEGKKVDFFSVLLEKQTLKQSELRRPIFAYMVYQLIINDIDFLSIGKIGVYLSFLNLLTKEAKHVNDKDSKVDPIEEIKYRNTLHATSKLWMFKRQVGNQGFMKKADICRVLAGEKINEDDAKVLELYNAKSVKDIHFLSHSYFGENDNVLSFQHQSFAEILIAEYYLKVIIKYALDNESINEAEIKLFLGEPTHQSIQFLKELVNLLKETSVPGKPSSVIEKRKLLFPLLASLCVKDHNKDLFCSSLYFKWYEQNDLTKVKQIPTSMLENWCINKDSIDKIIDLCARLLNSRNEYTIGEVSEIALLYEKELIKFDFSKTGRVFDIHKWIVLLVGNEMENEVQKGVFFNKRIGDPEIFVDLVKNWNRNRRSSSPNWASSYFCGINFYKKNQLIDINYSDFSGLNFSYSRFRNVRCEHTHLWGCDFSNCSFHNVKFSFSYLDYSTFDNIKLEGRLGMELTSIGQGLFFPYELAQVITDLFNSNHYEDTEVDDEEDGEDFAGIYANFGPHEFILRESGHHFETLFNLLRGFIVVLKSKKGGERSNIERILLQKENSKWNESIKKQLNLIYK